MKKLFSVLALLLLFIQNVFATSTAPEWDDIMRERRERNDAIGIVTCPVVPSCEVGEELTLDAYDAEGCPLYVCTVPNAVILNAELDETSAYLRSLQEDIAEGRDLLTQLKRELADLQRNQTNVEATVAGIDALIAQEQAELDDLRLDLVANQQELDLAWQEFEVLARETYPHIFDDTLASHGSKPSLFAGIWQQLQAAVTPGVGLDGLSTAGEFQAVAEQQRAVIDSQEDIISQEQNNIRDMNQREFDAQEAIRRNSDAQKLQEAISESSNRVPEFTDAQRTELNNLREQSSRSADEQTRLNTLEAQQQRRETFENNTFNPDNQAEFDRIQAKQDAYDSGDSSAPPLTQAERDNLNTWERQQQVQEAAGVTRDNVDNAKTPTQLEADRTRLTTERDDLQTANEAAREQANERIEQAEQTQRDAEVRATTAERAQAQAELDNLPANATPAQRQAALDKVEQAYQDENRALAVKDANDGLSSTEQSQQSAARVSQHEAALDATSASREAYEQRVSDIRAKEARGETLTDAENDILDNHAETMETYDRREKAQMAQLEAAQAGEAVTAQERAIAEKAAEIDGLAKEQDTIRNEMTERQQKIDELEAAKDALDDPDSLEAHELQDQIDALNQEQAADQQEIDDLQQQIEKRENELGSMYEAYEVALERSRAAQQALQTTDCQFKDPNTEKIHGTGQYCVQLSSGAEIGTTVAIHGATGIDLIKNYAGVIYRYFASIIGIICVLIIVVSGVQMSMAGFNTELSSSAKTRIFQALASLILLFAIGLILKTVNPTFYDTGGGAAGAINGGARGTLAGGAVAPGTSASSVVDPNSIDPMAYDASNPNSQFGGMIVGHEAQRGADGEIKLYNLPSNDGGGTHEYAGINSKYHPDALREIESLKAAGRHADAEQYAANYIGDYTATHKPSNYKFADDPGVEFFVRDSTFNRGGGGARNIVNRANQMPASNSQEYIQNLRVAREDYERENVGYRSNLWNGLNNRWNNVERQSLALSNGAR